MKPLRIELRQFGPYVSHEVDLAPFLQQGLFLIHGDTGSGKSTLLDALAWALYGRGLGVRDRDALLRRRGASPEDATSVTVDFALGPRVYQVRRTMEHERASRRGGGVAKQRAEATLRCLHGDDGFETVSSPKAVNEAVERLLQLPFAQFSRVVVLPQGEFRQLLLSPADRQEELLQQIFGTARFEAAETALRNAAREAEQRCDARRGTVDAMLRGLDLDVPGSIGARRAELVREVQLAERSGASARRAAEEARARYERMSRDLDRERRRRAVEAERALLESGRAEAEAARLALARAEAAARCSPALVAMARAEGEVEAARAELRRAEAERAETEVDGASLARVREVERSQAALRKELDGVAGALRDEATATQAVESLERRIEAAREREALAGQVGAAKKAERDLERARALAAERAERARGERDRARRAERAAMATRLAAELREGEPCAVCGSKDHPSPALPSADRAVADVAEAERAAEEGERDLRAAERRRDEKAFEHRSLADRLEAMSAEDDASPESLAALHAGAVERRTAARRARERGAEVARAVAAGEAELARLRAEVDTSRDRSRVRVELSTARLRDVEGGCEREREALSDALAREGFRSAEEARSHGLPEAELSALREGQRRRREAEQRLSAELGSLGPVGDAVDEAAVEAAGREAAEAADAVRRSEQGIGALRERVERIDRVGRDLEAEQSALEADEARWRTVQRVSAVVNGHNPAHVRLGRWVLLERFDRVVACASARLESMSDGRFRLRRAEGRSAGREFELSVDDAYTGALERSVATLSGGEMFMASLAMALGLGDVLQAWSGGVRVESLFVDEGFGSLDEDALDKAVSALERLPEHDRLVGVVSHLAELRRRIPARLEVTRGERGAYTRGAARQRRGD